MRFSRFQSIAIAFGLILAFATEPALSQFGLKSPTVVSSRSSAPAGGPDVFYYSFGNSNPTEEAFWGGDQFYAVPVTATVGGSITKVGWKLHETEGAINNIRIGLWRDAGGGTFALHECQVLALPANSAAAFYDITLSSPYTVASSEIVRVSAVSEDGGLNVGRFHTVGDTGGYKVTRTYASGCSATEPTWGGSDESDNGARIFVD